MKAILPSLIRDKLFYIVSLLDYKTRKVFFFNNRVFFVCAWCREVRSLWRPEYAEYMVEGTPGQPYGWLVQHFNVVEHNMTYRRRELSTLLEEDEVALSLTVFPR